MSNINQSSVFNLIAPFHFGAFEQVTHRASISDLFKMGPAPGLYVLAFSDGAYYAGKTKDVKQRFRAHRRNHGDIDYLAFKSLSVSLQDEEEKPLVQMLKSNGIRLRNIQFISDPDTSREIDDMIPLSAQERWIETGQCADQDERQINDEQRYRYARKYQKLVQEPAFKELRDFILSYRRVGLIAPRMTEKSYWCASVWPSPSEYVGKETGREYIRINIGNCEVLTIGKDWSYQNNHPGPFFVFHTALPADTKNIESYLREKHPDVMPVDHLYSTMGENQAAFVAFGYDAATRLLSDPIIQKAIRQGNMSLMRKRACLYSQNHCYDLADNMLEDDDKHDGLALKRVTQ